jgi:hypothetical protein
MLRLPGYSQDMEMVLVVNEVRTEAWSRGRFWAFCPFRCGLRYALGRGQSCCLTPVSGYHWVASGAHCVPVELLQMMHEEV